MAEANKNNSVGEAVKIATASMDQDKSSMEAASISTSVAQNKEEDMRETDQLPEGNKHTRNDVPKGKSACEILYSGAAAVVGTVAATPRKLIRAAGKASRRAVAAIKDGTSSKVYPEVELKKLETKAAVEIAKIEAKTKKSRLKFVERLISNADLLSSISTVDNLQKVLQITDMLSDGHASSSTKNEEKTTPSKNIFKGSPKKRSPCKAIISKPGAALKYAINEKPAWRPPGIRRSD